MSSRNVLVTGGAGFIGSHLVDALAADPEFSVTVLDDLSSGRMENLADVSAEVRFVEGDIRDRDTVRECMEGQHAVIHLAAIVSVPQSIENPSGTHHVNVGGTTTLLEEAHLAGVERFVFASSSAIYGDAGSRPIPEDTTPRPLSPYGEHKLAGEQLCRERTGGPDCVCLRYFNIYGPRQRDDSDYSAVIPLFRARCRAGKPVKIHGDGEQTRDFVHVQDVVEVNRRALLYDGELGGKALNVGRGVAVSIDDLAWIILGLEDVEIVPEHGPERAGDIRHSVADVSELEAVLDFVPEISLEDGLASE